MGMGMGMGIEFNSIMAPSADAEPIESGHVYFFLLCRLPLASGFGGLRPLGLWRTMGSNYSVLIGIVMHHSLVFFVLSLATGASVASWLSTCVFMYGIFTVVIVGDLVAPRLGELFLLLGGPDRGSSSGTCQLLPTVQSSGIAELVV